MLAPRTIHCETEYRRNFKKSRYTCSASTYRQNLDFRLEQKKRFIEHNPEPFAWDPEEIDSDSGSELSCDDLNKQPLLTATQYKHEKLNRLYQKRMTTGSKNDVVRSAEMVSSQHKKRENISSHIRREEPGETEEEDSGAEGDSDASVVHIIEPEFQEVPTAKPTLQVANKQTQTEKKAKQPKCLPPFLPYGYKASVKETGKKLTHNIQAAKQIYPSALRAQKLRKAAGQYDQTHVINTGTVSKKSHEVSDHLRPTSSEPIGIFIHSDEYDSPDWVTEYDRNYQPYNPNEYKKRPSSIRVHARELIPQVSSRTHKQTRK